MSRLSITWLGHSTFLISTPERQTHRHRPVARQSELPAGIREARVAEAGRSHPASRTATATTPAMSSPLSRATDAPVVCLFELALYLEREGTAERHGHGHRRHADTSRACTITMTQAVHTQLDRRERTASSISAARPASSSRGERRQTIYFAGDTALFGDMKIIGEIYQTADRVSADRRSLHDGAGHGGDRGRMARRAAGRADALGHVPAALRARRID